MSDSVVPLWFYFTSLFGVMLLASYLCGKRLAKIISLADAQLKAEREKALREAASLSWLCFHRCDVEVDVVTAEDILALIKKDATDV